MKYLEVIFDLPNKEEYIFDLLADNLASIGFESFEIEADKLKAFISESNFATEKVAESIANFEYASSINYVVKEVEDKNWNEVWEKNFFQPIIIDDLCVIHSTFHTDVPKAKYDIIIDPKMAFGTGHHQTTGLIIRYILENNFEDKKVLDMGCGTSILAILAKMRGAKSLLAVDIDDWCTRNSIENIMLNKISDIEVLLGDASLLEGRQFDVILANINRNILMNDIEQYAKCLSSGGELYMSGFYVEDIPVLNEVIIKNGLQLVDQKEDNKWAAIKTIKL